MKPIPLFLILTGISVVGVAAFYSALVSQRATRSSTAALGAKILTIPTGTPAPATSAAEPSQSENAPVLSLDRSRTVQILARFKDSSEKVIKTQLEDAEEKELLSNRELISKTVQILLEIPSQNSEGVRRERMNAIDFLEQALAWNKNPEKKLLVSKLVEFISMKVSQLPASPEIRGIWMGDKIEAIGLLGAVQPQLAARLQKSARGSIDERLFQYAKNMYGQKF
ncbi:hypothetical protein K2X30_06220 [bacterium]|jgi:hypothetical protein|nr:hypothetical protein [bacterium]